MLADTVAIDGASDIVAENVTVLPTNPPKNTLVYLTQVNGSFNPGLYIFSEVKIWILLTNSAPVTD